MSGIDEKGMSLEVELLLEECILERKKVNIWKDKCFSKLDSLSKESELEASAVIEEAEIPDVDDYFIDILDLLGLYP